MRPFPPLSPSMRTAWRTCGRKVFFRYVAGIEPARPRKALMIGSAFHDGLEAWRRGEIMFGAATRATEALRTRMEPWFGKDEAAVTAVQLNAYLMGYAMRFKADVAAMKLVEVQAFEDGGDETGFVDSVMERADGTTWVVEDKTTARFEDRELTSLALTMNDQVATYVLSLLERGIPVTGVLYRQTKKTQTSVTKKETLTDYAVRVLELYTTNADDMYREIEVRFTPEQLATWRFHKQRDNFAIQSALTTESFDHWPYNPGQCIGAYGPCEYLKLCATRRDEAQRDFKPNGKEMRDDGKFAQKIWGCFSGEGQGHSQSLPLPDPNP